MTRKILLVAERGRDFTIVRDLLGQTELTFELDWATTCEAALGKLARESHDIALVADHIGQHSAADLFRLGGGPPGSPILVILADDDRALEDEMMAAGAADVLSRHRLDPGNLGRSIRHALWRSERVRSLHQRVIQLAAVVELDAAGLGYIGDGDHVPLRQPPFAVLVRRQRGPGGSAPGELLGDGYERIHPYLEAAAGGRIVDLDTEMRGPSGRFGKVRIVLTPDVDGRDVVVGVLLSLEDISSPHGSSGIGLAEERLRDFGLASSEWLWETDLDLRLVYLSEGAEATIGRKSERLRGACLWDIGAVDEYASALESLRQDLEAGKPIRDIVLDYADDQRLPRAMAISGYALWDADGHFRGYRGIGRDVTDTIRSAARELDTLEEIIGPMVANLTRQAFGQGPLEQTMPEVFAELVAEYTTELERAVSQGFYQDRDGSAAQDMAQRMGFLRASARDVVKVHRAALARILGAASADQTPWCLESGRVMLTKVLMHLVSYFRGGFAGDRSESVVAAIRR